MKKCVMVLAAMVVACGVSMAAFDAAQFKVLSDACVTAKAANVATPTAETRTAQGASLEAARDYALQSLWSSESKSDSFAVLDAAKASGLFVGAAFDNLVRNAGYAKGSKGEWTERPWRKEALTEYAGARILSGDAWYGLLYDGLKVGIYSDTSLKALLCNEDAIEQFYLSEGNAAYNAIVIRFSTEAALLDAVIASHKKSPTLPMAIRAFAPLTPEKESYIGLVTRLCGDNKDSFKAAVQPVRVALIVASTDTKLSSEQREQAKAKLSDLFLTYDALGIPR